MSSTSAIRPPPFICFVCDSSSSSANHPVRIFVYMVLPLTVRMVGLPSVRPVRPQTVSGQSSPQTIRMTDSPADRLLHPVHTFVCPPPIIRFVRPFVGPLRLQTVRMFVLSVCLACPRIVCMSGLHADRSSLRCVCGPSVCRFVDRHPPFIRFVRDSSSSSTNRPLRPFVCGPSASFFRSRLVRGPSASTVFLSVCLFRPRTIRSYVRFVRSPFSCSFVRDSIGSSAHRLYARFVRGPSICLVCPWTVLYRLFAVFGTRPVLPQTVRSVHLSTDRPLADIISSSPSSTVHPLHSSFSLSVASSSPADRSLCYASSAISSDLAYSLFVRGPLASSGSSTDRQYFRFVRGSFVCPVSSRTVGPSFCQSSTVRPFHPIRNIAQVDFAFYVKTLFKKSGIE
uniref:Uncharacterized protein n=1 Tax=Caenorhabditis japonica TaxID=281687 RepID=A0A8R1IHF8_CAEJA